VDRADPPPLRHRGLQVPAMKEYYDRRAPEYDDWYLGIGLYADRERPSWDKELRALERVISRLQPGRTLDVACGTGFLTRHLSGEVVGLDQSESMLHIARNRISKGSFVQGDAFSLPFPDSSFDRVLTGHFYGHLQAPERQRFLTEAYRVSSELVVVDAALRNDVEAEEWQERTLSDGSRYEVYKRFFTGRGLAEEMGGGEILFEGRWFVVVRSMRVLLG
jgi:ubiquinone/menaquinone biosynthesis C-methylase UbiE